MDRLLPPNVGPNGTLGSNLLTLARWPQLGPSASPDEIVSALTPMLAVFGIGQKSEAEWTGFWKLYIDALGGLPASAIVQGVRDYLRRETSEFFPKPGPLHAICAKIADKGLDAQKEAREAVKPVAWYWPSEADLEDMTAAERKRQYRILAHECRRRAGPMNEHGVHAHPDWIVKAQNFERELTGMSELESDNARRMAADAVKAMTPPKEMREAVRPPQGKVDETGITPELRALIGRGGA
jgi:hypothetical protein